MSLFKKNKKIKLTCVKKTVKVKLIHDDEECNPKFEATVPTYGSPKAAGADVYTMKSYLLESFKPVLVKTGLSMQIPAGHMIQVCTRSGTALSDGLFVLNAPGIFDEDYRGELGIILVWTGAETTLNKFEIVEKDGVKHIRIPEKTRVAQLVMTKVERPEYKVVDELDSTDRGEGGFGSTGLK